jgi:hypothetical protein
VALSSLFWILSKLSRTYTAVIDLPIQYEHLPDDRIWLLDRVPTITLEVEGYGFDLLGYRYRNRNNLVLDLTGLNFAKGEVSSSGPMCN